MAEEFTPAQSLLGLTVAVCPYCDAQLEKKPGRKKKCPDCGNFIYVRMRPQDRERVLLREDQLILLEEQWSIANGTHEQFLAVQSRTNSVTDQLRVRFDRDPSENEVQWVILKADAADHKRNQNWGLYRNSRFMMAEILDKEERYFDCLSLLLEVCFLDLNGPNNCGGITNHSILREFPPFDPKLGDFAPGVIARLTDAMDNTETSIRQLESQFDIMARRLSHSMPLPVSTDKAWRKLKREIKMAQEP